MSKEVAAPENIFLTKRLSVEHTGTKIVLPSLPRPMTYEEGITVLHALIKEEAQKVGISEVVECFPLEGAWALRKVLEQLFGHVMTADATPATLFSPEEPGATMMTIEISPGVQDQVMWGKFHVPGVTGELSTGYHEDPYTGNLSFAITGTVRKRDQQTIKGIAEAVRNFVALNSLYRGKAIKIRTVQHPRIKDRYIVDFNTCPQFIDTSKVRENELIFSQDVRGLNLHLRLRNYE